MAEKLGIGSSIVALIYQNIKQTRGIFRIIGPEISKSTKLKNIICIASFFLCIRNKAEDVCIVRIGVKEEEVSILTIGRSSELIFTQNIVLALFLELDKADTCTLYILYLYILYFLHICYRLLM